MTDQRRVAERVRVTTRRHPLKQLPMLPAYCALADRFGTDQVYLLESAAGPAGDRRYRFAGFGALLSLSVTDGTVTVTGRPALARLLTEAVGHLLAPGDGTALRLRSPSDLWPLLRAAAALFDADGSPSTFRFGFLGYFGYDTVRYVEELPHLIEDRTGLPDVELVLHQGCVVDDLDTGRTELLLHESAHWPALDADDITGLLLHCADTHPEPDTDTVPEAEVSDDTDPDVFAADVERCLRHIAVGDIYQVQIGHELSIRSAVDPVHVYRRLRRRNASPYMYLTSIAGHRVIGASPELFVRIEDGTVTMRPIAGTAPRSAAGSAGSAEDAAAATRLRNDPKEIAEHTMLVDLCRNDIGRICAADTLDVPDRLVVEGYSHVLHLVSTVLGQAAEGTDAFDIVPALFPAGTMTGTPKIRAMEIIESVERSRRGLYAGALGLLDVGGYTNLALCIRTLFHHADTYRTRASAGIVADSVPASEWRETLAKMSAAHWAVAGKELL
ncbi:anthranilate synthase component I family protein [Streptomyces bambusae]|uniref:anthranilate synthase component I family protein n=1 Tax=Streptomyces bambusae TaxID=1550616 RepID=UPI001CFF0073|nr:anthranilate synthase component I family protein [Streptomyces bambusae]MCB5165668.1 anthranilate synthase component I family protein [Streptomyces bambusae]